MMVAMTMILILQVGKLRPRTSPGLTRRAGGRAQLCAALFPHVPLTALGASSACRLCLFTAVCVTRV